MFDAEAKGLRLLASADAVRIPKVMEVIHGEQHDALLLEFIETRRTTYLAGERLGQRLANLHRVTQDEYGLDHDNYMGSLVQTNTPESDLCRFFIESRLEPQMKIARKKGAFDDSFTRAMNRFYERLPDLLISEPPSLLHGDLWSGNYLVDQDENPVLIDPAVCFGHREMDIAMTTLFGGFPDSFYSAYQESWPLQEGYQERLDIYNLYPLLVHVNLFGGGYAAQVRSIVSRYTG